VKKKRFSVEQITAVLQQVTGGCPWGMSAARSASRSNVLPLEEDVCGMPPVKRGS